MPKINSLAKITAVLLASVALAGIAFAQTEPVWPVGFTKPAAAPAVAAAAEGAADVVNEDPLAILDEPFSADPAAGATPPGIVDPLLDMPPAVEMAPVDPMAPVDGVVSGLAEPERTPDYISGPAAPSSEASPAPAEIAPSAPVANVDGSVGITTSPVEDAPASPVRIAPTGGVAVAAGATEFASGNEVDPVTAAATNLVRDTGLIARQSDMGEGLLLMERQLNFAENVNQLISIMGPDVEIEVAPGVYQSYADTPAGRKAELELLRLEQEAQFANLDFELKLKEREAALIIPPEGTEFGPDGELLPLRSDGGEFQDINGAPATGAVDPLTGLDQAALDALTAKVTEQVKATMPQPEAAPAEPVPLYSLREIFGSEGDYLAVISSGNDRVRVRAGDDLPNGIKVLAVGDDYVEIETDGVTSRLSIRG